MPCWPSRVLIFPVRSSARRCYIIRAREEEMQGPYMTHLRREWRVGCERVKQWLGPQLRLFVRTRSDAQISHKINGCVRTDYLLVILCLVMSASDRRSVQKGVFSHERWNLCHFFKNENRRANAPALLSFWRQLCVPAGALRRFPIISAPEPCVKQRFLL